MSNSIYNEQELCDTTARDSIHKRINQHESKLVKVETILERVALNQDSMAESLSAITKSMGKQELILEKLAHLEENTKGSINRIHDRIDKEIEERKEEDTEIKTTLSELDLARTLSKYPKLAAAVLVVAYLFTIKEFRDVFTGGIGG